MGGVYTGRRYDVVRKEGARDGDSRSALTGAGRRWRGVPEVGGRTCPDWVLLLQAGNAASFFGYGLIFPFEIICLHQIRHFATATAGLVLATILGTATLVTPPSGALLDHFAPSRS